jgi:hypothetical protein
MLQHSLCSDAGGGEGQQRFGAVALPESNSRKSVIGFPSGIASKQ